MATVDVGNADTRAFIENIKTTPLYVAFFHGVFDTCLPQDPLPHTALPLFLEGSTPASSRKTADPSKNPVFKMPPNVSLMQLTEPGETLSLSPTVLYYLIHKPGFYTKTLMPIWAVKDPKDLLAHHPGVHSLHWDLENRKGRSYDEIVLADKIIATTDKAVDGLKLMSDTMTKEPFDSSSKHKTHFEKVLRFMGSDQIPNLKLARYDPTMEGLGLYKYDPITNKVVLLKLSDIHDASAGIAELGEDTLRLYHLVNYVSRVGGGRIVLFSCASLSPSERTNAARAARGTIRNYQTQYIDRNPVMSPRNNWDLFVQAFPEVNMPDLTFVNAKTRKALDNSVLSWIYVNLLAKLDKYEHADTAHKQWRIDKIQKKTAHGRVGRNIGQPVTPNENMPDPEEGWTSYMCKRTKQGCTVMGGGNRTRRIRSRSRNRNRNRNTSAKHFKSRK
jgi:hypothetical protein